MTKRLRYAVFVPKIQPFQVNNSFIGINSTGVMSLDGICVLGHSIDRSVNNRM